MSFLVEKKIKAKPDGASESGEFRSLPRPDISGVISDLEAGVKQKPSPPAKHEYRNCCGCGC